MRNKCLHLPNGRILAPASREIGPWYSFIDRSDDGGKTWDDTATIPVGTNRVGLIQPTLWREPSGKLHAYMRSNKGYIWESSSTDDGSSWSEARSTGLPNNNSGIDLVRGSDNALYLAMNPISGDLGERSVLVIMKSSDEDRT